VRPGTPSPEGETLDSESLSLGQGVMHLAYDDRLATGISCRTLGAGLSVLLALARSMPAGGLTAVARAKAPR
jgi:hypothetical protein